MNLKKMEKIRERYLEELRNLKGWITGSLVVTERKQSGETQPFRYLSRSIGGKNRITYLSEKQEKEFKRQLKCGKRAEQLFKEITELTVKITKLTTKRK